MIDKDIRWFQFLKSAILEKYRNPALTHYGGYRYENIFKWTRGTLETIQKRHGINLADYLNIHEKGVLEKLVKNLQTDPRLTFFRESEPQKIANFELPDQFHEEVEQEQLVEQQAAAQQPPAGQPPPSAPFRGPSMPQMPPLPTPETANIPSEQPEVEAGKTPEAGQKPSQEGKTSSRGRGFNFPRMPNFAKNAGSNAGIFIKKGTSRAAVAASKGIGGAIGAGGKSALRAGNFGINFGLNLSNEFSRLRVGTIGKKWILGLLLILFMLGMLLFATGAGFAPAPIPGGSSCPVSSGKITYPSYQADNVNGHCTSDIEGVCPAACPFDGRRAKSIDVDTSGGKDVILPTINGQTVQWKFIQALCAGSGTYPNCTSNNGGTGGLYTFEGTISGQTDKWYIQFVHMQIPAALTLDNVYASGTVVGKTDVNIVHITVGKNIKNPFGSGTTETDCDAGWIPADVGLGMCTGNPIASPVPVPPNQDTCGGKYTLNNPLGNFGDPLCDFTKDKLYDLLKQSDPTNADYWFLTLIPCESGYNPNAYNPLAVDPAGAWGLYQMGRGKNGDYDHGDVIWTLQTSNAINYNNYLASIGQTWHYWACAKDRW